MDNHAYNLIASLAEKADGAWVYDSYIEDSNNCNECKTLFEKMKARDEEYVTEMKQLLIDHVKNGGIE